MSIKWIFLLLLIHSKSYAQLFDSIDVIKTTGRLEAVDALILKRLQQNYSITETTKDALLSYPIIEERANEFVQRIQRSTLGDYAYTIGYLAPFVTGEVRAKVSIFDISFNIYEGFGKLEYSVNF